MEKTDFVKRQEAGRPKAHIAVGTPTYDGKVCTEYMSSVVLSAQKCLARGVFLEFLPADNFSLVEFGRSWIVAEFLSRPELTHLLWIDSDLGWDPTAPLRMLQRNVDVCAGVYSNKHPTHPQFPYEALGPMDATGLQQAAKVPGGFMLLTRHAVETIAKRVPVFEIEHNGTKRMSPRLFMCELVEHPKSGVVHLLGEDFVLCHHLREAGFTIWVETDIPFQHLGKRAWHSNLCRTLSEEVKRGVGQGTAEAHAFNAGANGKVDAAMRGGTP